MSEAGLRERIGRVLAAPTTDFAIIVLIVVSVVLIAIEYAVTMSPPTAHAVAVTGEVISGVFALELSLRFYVAKKKSRFFRRYWLDILAILPLFRPFRLLRLFRLGLLLTRRVSLLGSILRVNVYEVWVLTIVTAIAVIGSGLMAYFFESRTGNAEFSTLERSVWWALHSLIAGEPVGGMPTTFPGRILLVAVMLAGTILFAVFTGVVSATMIDRLGGRKEVWEMDIDELEKHTVICGWNAGVPSLVAEISGDAALKEVPIVLVNDLDERPRFPPSVRPELLYFLRGDHTRLDVLTAAGIARASRAVVMADTPHGEPAHERDARTVLAALTIEKLNPTISCTVELMDPANESHLRVAGVEAIVARNDLAGRVLAAACRTPRLVNVYMELLTVQWGSSLRRMPGPRAELPFGQVLLEYRRDHDVLVIGVDRDGAGAQVNPPDSFIVRPTDKVIAISGRSPNSGS